MQAKGKGAKLIHVDPRFTRTSAMADIHAPIRAGTDIAFLGGLIHYVLNSERWTSDPFFKTYVTHYTNAATIINEAYQDAEELNGVFSGLMAYTSGSEAWPFNGFVGEYDSASWQYAHTEAPPDARGGTELGFRNDLQQALASIPPGPPFEPLIRALRRPAPTRDETLQDPRTVFQIIKRHFSRYTPEMVEQVTGCPQPTLTKIAETLLDNSGPERTTAWCYAVGWTQHTYGPQMIGCCALLQLLLGNFGRPGGGIMALRGHASIQGSTDIPTLYHSIPPVQVPLSL
jgi:formate dehydrogenase major subunit